MDTSAVVDPAFSTRLLRTQAEMYTAGEELFALRNTQHPELVKTKKETCLLDQLYGLYMDVVHTLERWGMDRRRVVQPIANIWAYYTLLQALTHTSARAVDNSRGV